MRTSMNFGEFCAVLRQRENTITVCMKLHSFFQNSVNTLSRKFTASAQLEQWDDVIPLAPMLFTDISNWNYLDEYSMTFYSQPSQKRLA